MILAAWPAHLASLASTCQSRALGVQTLPAAIRRAAIALCAQWDIIEEAAGPTVWPCVKNATPVRLEHTRQKNVRAPRL